MCNSDSRPASSGHLQPTAPKGVVIVIVAVLLIVLLSCVALAVDIGYLYVARTELQRTADAAALAGAQALARAADDPLGVYSPTAETVYAQVGLYASLNTVLNKAITIDYNTDIKIGYLANPHDLTTSLQFVPVQYCNAVQVIARRSSANLEGEIGLFFGSLFGVDTSALAAAATAVIDDRFSGYVPLPLGGVPALPIAVDKDFWNDQIVAGNGPDQYGYDPNYSTVQQSADGVPEITLYPKKLDSGNFGLLQVGPNSGTSVIVEQINNGISPEDFVDLSGEPMIEFFNEASGGAVTYNTVSYDVLGNPGLKAGLKDALHEKIGRVVGFFIYETVAGEGDSAVFNVTGMRFGRVMEVDLTSGDRVFIIQPVSYSGPDIITSPSAPSTNGFIVGSFQLVR